MGFADLMEDLKGDEGIRLKAYPDPLSGGEPYTIGYGHTGGIVPGQRCSFVEARQWLEDDIHKAIASCDKLWPQWRVRMNDARQDVLVNMMFNMGYRRLSGFVETLKAMKRGDFVSAAEEMLDSRWAKQVGRRVVRLAKQMETGKRDE